MAAPPGQQIIHESPRGRVVVMDSAYDVGPDNHGRDVVVNASYCGVLPARFIAEHHPRAAIGVDCGVGPAGASIAGLWYLEALNIPAAAADVMTVRLGDGLDLHDRGVVSFANRPAAACGVHAGLPVHEAARLLLEGEPGAPSASDVTNRQAVLRAPDGRAVVCTDSIAFGLPEDRDRNVLVTAGHTGRSAVPYLLRVRPHGFICSDGGWGRDGSGVAGLEMVESAGLAGAAVDARRARMGDAMSSWVDGIITARNSLAAEAGVEVGMTCQEAATLLLSRAVVPRTSGDGDNKEDV